ncbi:hypothetical protein BGZ99_002726 [Dissophora globulifera]|uniref:Uncharacterized protein n=1 Tax=Dissophora globulifera TaxID=979702 RepID=A0A9P6UW57_9FUNG|nr:hypothetical protein BGZ99_002726 [Dissophora globulifera]
MKPVFSTSAASLATAGALILSTIVSADRVYWTLPTNNSNIYAGCDMDIGYRVQYSDLAMLAYVQIQVLNAESTILIDSLDNSTRADWDDHRGKNITWSVPQDWTSGDYTLRAFGDAPYPCTENGHRTFCKLQLEARLTIHLQDLQQGQSCPSTLTSPSLQAVSSSGLSSATPIADSTDTAKPTNEETDADTDMDKDESASQAQSGLHIEIDPAVLRLMRENSVARVGASDTLSSDDSALPSVATGEEQVSMKTPEKSPKELAQQLSRSTNSGAIMDRGVSKMGFVVGLAALTVAAVLL